MEKVLKLYTYIDGVNDTPFPNKDEQVITSDFRSDYKRMGGVPTISCTIMHPLCLDKLWTDNVYATFNGEKFFIKQVPTSSYDNTDARYKHELELVSERIILDNVYVYDVVTSDTTNDKPVSNSSKFVFFGTIHEFAERLNYSLQYSNLDYRVVVDDGISSEGKMVSFENQFFSNAIQEAYNTYEIPYYFVGKVIHIGFTDNAITHTFKYGQDESLLSIQKQNANYKIVNRVTGVGSADNIPYYYPNDYESKEEVEANGGTWINPQTNLMPSIYRDTLGEERFYKALNNTYISPQTGAYYEFENPFIEGKPKEHIVNFDDIKPSIVGMVNSNGFRIDMFQEFAYDLNDNDETDEEGNYLHPYFFGKLRKFDGEFGFNLFDHAIDEDEMVISMTSGNCGACEFVIGVDEDTQKNPVQVDDSGNLKRNSDGDVITSGEFQDRQNDTQNYEVWIALKKDINTFGVIMPNATNNYRPSTNDTFVILHIDLPKAYILAAEDKLKEELIKYMAMTNSEKFNFSIAFSRIFFAENPDILAQLNENARIQIEYDNELYELYVSSYSYNMSSDKPLPEIKVELSDTLTVAQNALQTAISEVKQDIMSSVGSIDWLQQGLRYFLRKDTNDRTRGKLSSDVAFEVGKYVSGASGAIIQVDKNTGQTVAELDKLYVRMKAYFETLEIINVNSVGGKMILSPAGSVTCISVEELDNAYRCYFLGEQDGEVIENRFKSGDQSFSQMFNAKVGVSNKVSNHYYWRLVTSVSEDVVDYNNQKCHYIDLSKTDCDSGSDIPKTGDVINQRGSRTDSDRMNFIEFSSVGVNAPYITLFQGVNSYSLVNKEYVSYGYDQSTGKAYMNVYGDMYVGDRNETSYMRYTQEGGLEIKGKLSVGTTLGGKDLQDMINAASPEGYQEFVDKVTQDIEGLQQQIDGAIESYFYQYEPSLGNYPAMEWDTALEKEAHLNDTFTNLVDGRSWRWTVENGVYGWTEITDTATTQALALAGQAKDTADGKRRVFTSQPTPPYDKGDLWSQGSDAPLMICVNPKTSGSYDASDWDYADNNVKLKEEMQSLVSTTKDELNNAIGQASEAANTYTDNAKAALEKSLAELDEAKAGIDSVYTKAEADEKISEAEQAAIDAAKQQSDAAIALSEEVVKAYADGKVSAEEEARIKQAQENLDAAKKYAEEKAKEAEDAIKNSYLFKALTEAPETTIENGLVLSSLIQLRNTDGAVKSGINGIINESKGDKSIANWWGGIMGDMTDYHTWNGSEWIANSGVTIPSNLPKGLIRMDGTGYLANGKFWWDETGKIYADPTALFLSFDVDDPAASLSTTILDVRDKQAEFSNMWELKEDSQGNKYLMSKYSIVTQGDVTAYADTTGLDINGIYDGLPIDGTTIYWENGVLKAQGGGGTSTEITSASIINALGYTPYDAANPNGFITSSALGDYLPLTGGTLSGHLTVNGYYFKAKEISGLALELSNAQPFIDFHFNSSTADYTTRLIEDVQGQLTLLGSFVVSNGATLISDSTVLTINGTGENNSTIRYRTKSTTVGYLGFNPNGVLTVRPDAQNNTNYYNVWHAGNFNPASYATTTDLAKYLPLTGGTVTGSTTFTENVFLKNNYLMWQETTNNRGGYFNGQAFNAHENQGYTARIFSWDNGGTLTFAHTPNVSGYVMLHSGNYSNYALPLSGGTMTGVLTLTPDVAYISRDGSGSILGFGTSNSFVGGLSTGAVIVGNTNTPLVARSSGNDLYHYRNDTASRYLILDAGNYNSYAPTLTGTGASGTWNISISGKSDAVDVIDYRNTNVLPSATAQGTIFWFNNTSNMPSGGAWWSGMHVKGWDTTYTAWEIAGWASTTAPTTGITGSLYWRNGINSTWNAWRRILDSSNYSSFALPLSGGTMAGAINFDDGTSHVKFAEPYGIYMQYKNGNYINVNSSGALFNNEHYLWHNGNRGFGFTTGAESGTLYYCIAELPSAASGSNTTLDLLVTRTHWFADTFAIIHLHIRNESGTIDVKAWHSVLNSGNFDLSGIILTKKVVSGVGTYKIYCKLYAPWYSYEGTVLNQSAWGAVNTRWTLYQSGVGTSALTAIPSDETVVGSPSLASLYANSIVNNTTTGFYVGDRNKGIGTTNGGLLLYTYGSTPIDMYVGGVNAITISGTCNVGIGTTAPKAKLSVVSQTSSNPALGSLGTANTVEFGSTGYYGTYFWTLGTGRGYIQQGRTDGTAIAYDLILQPHGGNVGIGTETPSYKLHVVGSAYSSGNIGMNAYGKLFCDGGTYKQWQLFADSTTAATWMQIAPVAGNAQAGGDYRISGISTAYLSAFRVYATDSYVYGNLIASGEVTAYSDARLKSNIAELNYRGRLQPKTYVKDGKQSIGFIAQDVQVLYPELVREEEYLSLNYDGLTAVLASQLNGVEDEVTRLKKRVKELEEKVRKYEERRVA